MFLTLELGVRHDNMETLTPVHGVRFSRHQKTVFGVGSCDSLSLHDDSSVGVRPQKADFVTPLAWCRDTLTGVRLPYKGVMAL